MTSNERVIHLQGTRNFRDLGGYENIHGQSVAWGRIFRAANLSLLSAKDEQKLAELKLKNDIDLRSRAEQERTPDKLWSGAKLTANPVYPEYQEHSALFSTGETLWKKMHHIPQPANSFAGIYQNVILNEHAQHAFARVSEILLNGEPTVFHCAAGKDRTGMTAALILLALEVPEETIIADYLLTNQLFDFEGSDQNVDESAIEQMVSSMNLQTGEAEVMKTVLDTINIGYGGIEKYWVKALGLKLEQLEKFREMFLE